MRRKRDHARDFEAAQRGVNRVPLYRPTYLLGKATFACEVVEFMQQFTIACARRAVANDPALRRRWGMT